MRGYHCIKLIEPEQIFHLGIAHNKFYSNYFLCFQKITVIAFVANTGGLLGLCMGFSLVSLFEIIYHLIGALAKWWERLPKNSEPVRPTSV
jgi:Amiloride-sensitive sodium channel